MADVPARALMLLRFIMDYKRRAGFGPSQREMQEAFGMKSSNSPRYYLGILERAGYLVRSAGLARTIRVTERGERAAG